MSGFQFKILKGSDPQAQYNAIPTKDSMTFYLLSNGTGYFGEILLFSAEINSDNSSSKFDTVTSTGELALETGKTYVVAVDGVTVNGDTLPCGIYYSSDGTGVTNVTYDSIAKYITEKAISDMTADGYTGDDDTIATTKAIVDYVKKTVSDQKILEGSFFKKVRTVILTENDINGSSELVTTYGNIFNDSGNHEGDVGLIFTLNSDSGDIYTFVNLHELINVYKIESTDTISAIETPGTHGSVFKVSLKINDESIEASKDGINIKKTGDLDKTLTASTARDNVLVTEKSMEAFVRSVLEDYVSYSIDK